MSALPANAVPSPIPGDLLARARAQAGRGSVMQALIELSASTPDDMCARVAAQLGLRAMHSADLNALTMALGGIRFSEALARSVGGEVHGDGVLVADASVFTALLVSPAGQAPTAPQCAWLAWLLWQDGQARVTPAQGGWLVRSAAPDALRADWLADAMERLGKDPV